MKNNDKNQDKQKDLDNKKNKLTKFDKLQYKLFLVGNEEATKKYQKTKSFFKKFEKLSVCLVF